jgi:hypothetical protein
MSTRVIVMALLGLALAACGSRPPPPCLGEACAAWPHIDLSFGRGRAGRLYTGALCVQVSFDCPEEGRHEVWIEPEHPRCETYLRTDGPEWLRVERGRISIPWPARCSGETVEMYVSAQPNFATCNAVNNQLLTVHRASLEGEVVFDCH